MSRTIALIGGSGFNLPAEWPVERVHHCSTPFGEASSEILSVSLADGCAYSRLLFLRRHGTSHHLAPHQINYRSNLWALYDLGAEDVIAVNAVGGLAADMKPGALALPSQLIDYTWGREHSFASADNVQHVDFSDPYTPALREVLIRAAAAAAVAVVPHGVYAATQGPRLESAAEIQRLIRDGATLVGMTGMPEAGLARELGLNYASVCAVANWGAGLDSQPLSMEMIYRNLESAMEQLLQILRQIFHPQPS